MDKIPLDQKTSHQCRMFDGDICKCKDIIPVRKGYLLNEPDIARFNAIYLLTGWFPDEMEFSGKRSEKVWEIFQMMFPPFTYRNHATPQKTKENSEDTKTVTSEPEVKKVGKDPRPLTTLDVKRGPSEFCKKKLYMEINCSMLRSIPLNEGSEILPRKVCKIYISKLIAFELLFSTSFVENLPLDVLGHGERDLDTG